MKYNLENYSVEKFNQDKNLVSAIHLRVPYFGQSRIDDVPELAKILKEYGFKGLRVNSNDEKSAFVPLSKLIYRNPERILEASKKEYLAAIKRINQFGNPAKRQEKSIESKLEVDGQLILFS